MKLLLDEQISGKVAALLRERGRDAIAVADEASLRGLGDSDLFEVAQSSARAVATFNVRDFDPLVREYDAADREHHGVIFIHPRRFSGGNFGGLAAAFDALFEAPPRGKSFVIWLQSAKPPERAS